MCFYHKAVTRVEPEKFHGMECKFHSMEIGRRGTHGSPTASRRKGFQADAKAGPPASEWVPSEPVGDRIGPQAMSAYTTPASIRPHTA